MALEQGTPLPNITTTQEQQTKAPSWYTDYLSNLATTGTSAGTGAEYVGAQPLQNQAFTNVASNVGNYQPALTAATNLANTAGGSDVATMAGNFMNPYTQNVVDALGVQGRRNIEQYLAPGATSAAVGSGQFGSKRGAEVLGQAINSGLSNLNAAQAQALQTGYTQALTAAQNQVANQLAGSQQLGNLATSTQALGLGDVNALATLGGQEQQIKQNESLFPLDVASKQAGILRGYTVPTSVASTYTGPIPGAYAPSPLQQIAGVSSLLAGVGQTDLGKTVGKGISGLFDDVTGLFKGSPFDATNPDNYTSVGDGAIDIAAGAAGNSNLPDWWWDQSFD
jgi:hypothetical protein